MSREYSERELLLLSNFVYIPACLSTKPISMILDDYRDESGGFSEESVYAAAAGGGMSTGDVKTVFTEMDRMIKSDPGFGKLSVSRCLNDANVRAICYTDEKDANPVVAFRGTGGTKKAWSDNFEGAFCDDTPIQKTADDFIKNECAIYKDIVVTGHSKGGNMAQYVTVKQQDRIRECVSFDGQGFGNDFLKEYPEEVITASPKIKSVSAYNDFVNILLTSIAGTCIYVANDSGAEAAHSPVTLLTANTFDEDGSFTSVRSQGLVSAELGMITDRICDALTPLSYDDKEVLSVIAGSAVSLALTTPADEMADGCLMPTAGQVAAHLACRLSKDAIIVQSLDRCASRSVYVDVSALRNAAGVISDQVAVIDGILSGIDNVRLEMARTITTRIFSERPLLNASEAIAGLRGKIIVLSEFVAEVADRYLRAEEEAAGLMKI